MQKPNYMNPPPFWLLWTYDPRERAVKLIEIVYWLLIFEGVFRKWILPFLSKPLYFIRDPFVMVLYYIAWKYGFFPTKHILFRIIVAISLLFAVIVAIQAFTDQNSLVVGLYGWRMYFFNIPFAFLCFTLLTGSDLKRIGRRTMLVGIPMAALTVIQYLSPTSAPINKLPDGGDGFSVGSVARASGTFTFTAGHALFTHALVCFTLANALLPAKSCMLRGIWLWPAIAGTFLNVILDGNRSIFLACIVTFISGTIYRVCTNGFRPSWRNFAPEIFCIIGGIIYINAFSDAYVSMSTKMVEQQEEGNGRLLSNFTSIFHGLDRTYILGSGIGAGTIGGRSMIGTQSRNSRGLQVDEEMEMSRVLQEAGPSGLFFVAYRYAMSIFLLVIGFKTSKRTRNPLPLILASYPAMILVMGQISLNGTSNGFAWIFVGFSLAANKLGNKADNPILNRPPDR